MIKYLVVIGVIAFVYYVFIKEKPKKTTKKVAEEETKDSEEKKEVKLENITK